MRLNRIALVLVVGAFTVGAITACGGGQVVVPGGPGDPGAAIVVFENVSFTPPETTTGGSVRWSTGATCLCDTAPYDFNVWGSTSMGFHFPGTATRGGVAEAGLYSVLQPGATIGPASNFVWTLQFAAAANWRQPGGVDGYLGFRFLNPTTSQVNYGYAHIVTGSNGRPATIVGWAYDQTGAAITIPAD